MLNLIINGSIESFSEQEFPNSVAELLKRLQLDAEHIVAEVDGEILSRDCFDSFILKNGQEIELVRFVGGG